MPDANNSSAAYVRNAHAAADNIIRKRKDNINDSNLEAGREPASSFNDQLQAGTEKSRIRGAGKAAEGLLNGLKIINGKVGGKIPVDEYKTILKSSIKNPDAKTMTLGKYTNGPDSYIARAGKDSTIFDMGEQRGIIRQKYSLTNKEIFDYFNIPALDDAISSGKIIRFSHNPLDYDTGALPAEWNYIKNNLGLADGNLIFEGGFWHVK